MVAPITGPYTKVLANVFYHSHTMEYYRQRRPYNTVLPLSIENYKFDPSSTMNAFISQIRAFTISSVNGESEAYNKAYAKFLGKLGDTASLGINLAQWRQAQGMISARALQLLAFTRALVSRSPLGVARALHISGRDAKKVMRTRHGASRTIADLWLEFWFGWKPLVSDIYSACEVLSEPLPTTRVKARAVVTKSVNYTNSGQSQPQYFSAYTSECTIGADVYVSNPNLRLLQQLGLINPASIAFDAVPWSFVLGWFSNVEAYLSSFTDFAGLTFQRSYVSKKTICVHSERVSPCDPRIVGCQPSYYLTQHLDGVGLKKTRVPIGTPVPPGLKFKDFRMPATRGLTAISLLVQKLPR